MSSRLYEGLARRCTPETNTNWRVAGSLGGAAGSSRTSLRGMVETNGMVEVKFAEVMLKELWINCDEKNRSKAEKYKRGSRMK